MNNFKGPSNNNTNAIMGNALGPNVYRLRINGNKGVFLNPQTLANLLGINVNKLNNTIRNKGNDNYFEKLNEIYGRRPVKNPYTRSPITKANIKKMAGPSKPVEINYSFNVKKARENAAKLAKAREKQERRAMIEAAGGIGAYRMARARQFFTLPRFMRRAPREPDNPNRNNNFREAAANARYTRNINRIKMTIPRNAQSTNWAPWQEIVPWEQREPILARLRSNYENYKRKSKELKKIPMYRALAKRNARSQLAALRKRMENGVRTLVGNNAANISRLNNTAFKNKVYYTLRSNGLRMKHVAYHRWYDNQYVPSYVA